MEEAWSVLLIAERRDEGREGREGRCQEAS